MFQRISNSFSLAKSSWNVLQTDKQLIIFPILSGIACVLIMATFAAPFIISPDLLSFLENENQQTPVWVYPVLFVYYFCNYFVVVFFNSALVSCAIIRFNGGTPTLGDGISTAMSRLPQIAAWAAVSATVGLILKAIENAHERAGAIVAMLLGTAWTVMTYFVIPVLVVEKTGPVDAVKRSIEILKKTWGEALVGHWGLGLFVFLLILPGLLLIFLAAMAMGQSAVLGISLLVLGILAVLLASAAGSALNGIFLGALYQYASTGEGPAEFDRNILSGAFGPKQTAS